jgi:hypothetical protein
MEYDASYHPFSSMAGRKLRMNAKNELNASYGVEMVEKGNIVGLIRKCLLSRNHRLRPAYYACQLP